MFSPFYIAFVQGMNINFTDVFPLWGLIACDVIYIKYSWQSFPITGALLEKLNFSVFVIKVLRSGDNVAVGDQGSRVIGEGWVDVPSLIYSSEILVYHDFHQNENFLVGNYKNQANIGWSPLPLSKSEEAQALFGRKAFYAQCVGGNQPQIIYAKSYQQYRRIASAWNFKATSQLKVWAFWSGGIPQYFSLFFSSSDALLQWGLNKDGNRLKTFIIKWNIVLFWEKTPVDTLAINVRIINEILLILE